MLRDLLVQQGMRLFRWRSYLPLLAIPLVVAAMRDGEYFEIEFGALADTLWESACIAIAFAGLALRAFTVGFVPAGTSGRNTRVHKADSLNRTGMYSIIRHPIYLANYVMVLGLLMFAQSLWLVIGGTIVFWIYYRLVVLAEEEFLRRRFGKEYERWAAATPAALPDPRRWVAPALPFSLRSVLSREYSTLYALVLLLSAMDGLEEIFYGDAVFLDDEWFAFLAVGTAIYLVLRTIKKHTLWLHEEGR